MLRWQEDDIVLFQRSTPFFGAFGLTYKWKYNELPKFNGPCNFFGLAMALRPSHRMELYLLGYFSTGSSIKCLRTLNGKARNLIQDLSLWSSVGSIVLYCIDPDIVDTPHLTHKYG